MRGETDGETGHEACGVREGTGLVEKSTPVPEATGIEYLIQKGDTTCGGFPPWVKYTRTLSSGRCCCKANRTRLRTRT